MSGVFLSDYNERPLQQIWWRVGDTLPAFVGRIVDEQGVPYDLTNKSVVGYLRRLSGVTDQTGGWFGPLGCIVLDPPNGLVYYPVNEGDTMTNIGRFELTLRVADLNGVIDVTAPTIRNLFVELRSNPVQLGVRDEQGDLIFSEDNQVIEIMG